MARHLAVMLDSGLPLAQAVRSISEQTENKVLQETLLVVLRDLENGYKLSEALEKHPRVFNHIFVSMVAAGESSGKLDVTLNLLAEELERDYGFRNRVIGAFMYPGFIVAAMAVVGIIMVTRIIPSLESVFKESGVELPWTTQAIIFVTNSIINYWFFYGLGLAMLVFLFVRYISTDDGRRGFNNMILKIPVINTLVVNLEMARFTRILGMLIQAGVPIIQALDSVALVLDSIVYREALQQVTRNVERGAPISQTLIKYPIFPSTTTEMIAAGEKTGKLEQVLNKLADFYETQTNQAIRNMSTLVEPIVFVIVGVGVAFLIFSIIVPIYNLSGGI